MGPREEHAFFSMNCRDKASAPNLLTEYVLWRTFSMIFVHKWYQKTRRNPNEMSHRPRCLTESLFNCIASSKLGSTVCCTEKTPKKGMRTVLKLYWKLWPWWHHLYVDFLNLSVQTRVYSCTLFLSVHEKTLVWTDMFEKSTQRWCHRCHRF